MAVFSMGYQLIRMDDRNIRIYCQWHLAKEKHIEPTHASPVCRCNPGIKQKFGVYIN